MTATLRRLLSGLLVLAPLVAVLIAWQYVGGRSQSLAFFISTPRQIFTTARTMLSADPALFSEALRTWGAPTNPDGGLLWNSGVTAVEATGGFLIGNLVGTLIGIALWYSQSVARIARPYLVALGALPVFAIAPITILWFGIGFGAKVGLAALATVFLAAAQTFKGSEQVDPLLVSRFRVLGASRWVMFRRLLLPSALAWIVASLRLNIGAALLGAFIGEFIASDQGLGHVIIRASGLYDTSRVLVGVAAMIAIALLLDSLVGVAERRLFRWRANGGTSA